MESLEATFGAANKVLQKKITIDKLIEKISINPRQILGIEIPSIIENKRAEMTVFDTDTDYTFEEHMILSKSKNSGFRGRELKGRAVAVINNDHIKTLSYG